MGRDKTVLMVYMTFANQQEAKKIAALLVKKKLAACVNILGKIHSIFEWKGAIEKSKEIAVIAKTTRARYATLEKLIKQRHSYECPCIVAWPVERGNAPFLAWVNDSTASKRQ